MDTSYCFGVGFSLGYFFIRKITGFFLPDDHRRKPGRMRNSGSESVRKVVYGSQSDASHAGSAPAIPVRSCSLKYGIFSGEAILKSESDAPAGVEKAGLTGTVRV